MGRAQERRTPVTGDGYRGSSKKHVGVVRLEPVFNYSRVPGGSAQHLQPYIPLGYRSLSQGTAVGTVVLMSPPVFSGASLL